ncbi:hypothetical protein Y886_37695, partial [Xanthomonas hyacinthi DSM 19077]
MPFRVAMVGPQPPERSGIAEYTAGLVEMLRDRGLHVDPVTQTDMKRRGVSHVLGTLRSADAVVYQMGNHPGFHGWMLPLMAVVPGIVHLHDLVLHHMTAGVLDKEGRLTNGDYVELLAKWQSPDQVRSAALALRSGFPIWNRDEVVHYPLHEVVTKFATEVIVHSHYTANRIAEVFPWLPVKVVPQLYPVVAPHRVRGRLKTIALMGGGPGTGGSTWFPRPLSAGEPGGRGPPRGERGGNGAGGFWCLL